MIFINKLDILRELNGGKPDREIEELIEVFIDELSNIECKSNFKIISTKDASSFLIGNDIKSYVENSKEIAVFLVTTNISIDQRLKRLEKLDKLAYIVFDKVTSHYIEDMAEKLQKEIGKELLQRNKYMLNRFSTGYGDYPIGVNEKIVDLLNGNRLGVFLTEKNMFMPSKTISGIIAAGDINKSFNFCKTCNLTNNCTYLKGGQKCYE